MLAIIKTGGKQYRVSPGQKIRIEKLDAQPESSVIFDEVLLVENGGKVVVGQPLVQGAKVEAKVLEQGRADKITIFKYKAKKRFHVKRGHRQSFTVVEVMKIMS